MYATGNLFRCLAVLAPLFLAPAGAFAAAARGTPSPGLPSYEAVYEVKLTRASEGNGPRAMSGTIAYRFAETCTAWETRSRTTLDLTFRDGDVFTNERLFSSTENKNARDYTFAVQTVKNNQTAEAFSGVAKLTGGGGTVSYTPAADPAHKVIIRLPRGTLLPVAYNRALIERANHGDSLFRTVVFNGASSSGPRIMSTVIGPRVIPAVTGTEAPSAENVEVDAALLSTPSWPMSSAYFNLLTHSDTPAFEMFMRYHDTGVYQAMEQDFGDFVVGADLKSLHHLNTPVCPSS